MLSQSEGSVGIFDSGFGGLTVLKALIQHLPEESYTYLGDSARLPYGTKSPQTIRRYLEQNIAFLKSLKVKVIIVACNSASSMLQPDDDFGLPVLGVIQPGAEAAAATTLNNKIAVIGTRATINGKSYLRAIQKLNPAIEVFQQACPLFVPLVEEGWEDDPLTNLIVHRYLSPLLTVGVDTMILGCTHYPVLRKSIQKVIRNNVKLIDSAETIAEQLALKITRSEIARNTSDSPALTILATDTGESFHAVAQKILAPIRFDSIIPVDIK